MKKSMKYLSSFLGWVFTILCVLALVFASFSFLNSKKTGEPVTVLGYRPVYVLTGSMEPFMMTDSIVITKTLEDGDELVQGDVVTYHVEDEEGKTLVITHRIKEINEDGTMITKGDNNRVVDAYPITRDNVEAKVVKPLNFVATLVHLWARPKGKVIICSGIAGIFVLYIGLKVLFSKDEEDEAQDTEK